MKKDLIFAFAMIGQIGFATAIPLVLLGLGGRYLDGRFGTAPYLFLLGLILAGIFAYLSVKRIVKEYLKELNKK